MYKKLKNSNTFIIKKTKTSLDSSLFTVVSKQHYCPLIVMQDIIKKEYNNVKALFLIRIFWIKYLLQFFSVSELIIL